jgi:hypothetical protein
VERAPEEGHPHGATVLERGGQGLGAERLDPGPQPHVGVARHLCLERDEPLDGSEDGHPSTAKEQLPLEQRAVERAVRQDPERRHRGSAIELERPFSVRQRGHRQPAAAGGTAQHERRLERLGGAAVPTVS